MKRLIHPCLGLLLSLFLNLGLETAASASGLLISIDGLTQSSGSGSFELVLTNTEDPGGTTFGIAGFSFELNGGGSGLLVTSADYPTGTPAYIFEGTGQSSLDPTIPLSTDTFPTADVSGADVYFGLSGLSAPVAPGDALALALITFTSPDPITINDLVAMIDTRSTVLSDENFRPIGYSLPVTAVPEPSSLAMVVLAGTLLTGLRRILS